MKSVVSHFMRNSLNDFYPDYVSLLFQIKQYLLVYLLDRQRYVADIWTRYMVNFGPCPYYKDKLLTALFTENTVIQLLDEVSTKKKFDVWKIQNKLKEIISDQNLLNTDM